MSPCFVRGCYWIKLIRSRLNLGMFSKKKTKHITTFATHTIATTSLVVLPFNDLCDVPFALH
jgi:hypothetical protein